MARLDFLDALRGLAALAVVLFHYCHQPDGVAGGAGASLFSELACHGHAAVYVFFVLSGFVLPWSMDRSRYTWENAGTFLARRWVRLWPPCAVVLVLMAIHRHGFWPRVEMWHDLWPQLLYVSGILEKPRYLEIFWTLELEFQFYVTIALTFPLLVSHRSWLRRLILAVFCLLPLAPRHPEWVTTYLGFFALGIAVFWWKTHRCHWLEMLAWVGLAIGIMEREFSYLNLGAGLLAVGLLCVPLPTPRALYWLGTISYSLYLTHIMCRAVASLYFPITANSPGKFAAIVLFHTVGALLFATGFYFLIEKPSQHWASKIGKRRKNLA